MQRTSTTTLARTAYQQLTAHAQRCSLHSSTLARAAAAAAPAPIPSDPSPKRYVRKTAVAASPVPRYSARSPPASRATSSALPPAISPSPARKPVPPPTVIGDAIDEYDFDYSSTPSVSTPLPGPPSEIDDYAQLSRPTPSSSSHDVVSPTSSAPLGASGQSYISLPEVQPAPARAPDIPGEVSAPAGLDWTTSFQGLSERPFDKDVADALLKPLEPEDVEVKPDGLLYLPEIKYRRTLNAAFGPGGWGLAPRGETSVGPRIVSREWGLVCLGRLVSIARGEQEYFDPSGIPTATEACKSNALMRCCKDLGIASELWDPRFIREFKENHCVEVFVEHITQKKKRKLWKKKGAKFDYPYKEV